MKLILWCPNPGVDVTNRVKVFRSDVLWSFSKVCVLEVLKTSQVKVLGGTLRKCDH